MQIPNFINKNIIPITIILFVSLNTSAALTADSLAGRLMYQVWSFPQEKVYVVTDRDAYTSGDTVRFRAFLVDAATHARPQQESRFVYVELRNPFGNVEKRVKIRSEEGKFAGIIHLDEELTEGNYTICAYTRFMENSGKDFFFRKTLPVFSQLSKKYRLDAETVDGNLRCTLTDRLSGREVRAEHISVMGADGNYLTQNVRKRSSYTMGISHRMREAGVVKVKFDRYEKYVVIPYDTAAVSLTFHPEGGWLVAGDVNRLAFKAIDRRGLSADFRGVIVDNNGRKVADISPAHQGMGMVDFTPEPGLSYRAVVDTAVFPLPEAREDAAVLQVSPLGRDSLLVRVAGRYRDGLSLIAHNGGTVTLATGMNGQELRLRRHDLGAGIVQLLLADGTGSTLSSRMIFNHAGYIYDGTAYTLPDGDYAIRAFRGIRSDSTASIVSSLLLQSELRGHIEDPDYYFRDRDSVADANLDLLMMTQGWQRYDIPEALKGNYAEALTPLEIGGEITGTVKSRWRGKPLENAVVMLLAPKMEQAAQAFTDKEGKFVFDGFDWPEETSFIIQAFGESGSKEHNYDVDKEIFPISESIATRADETVADNIIDESALTAGTIMLEELEVTAPMTLEESRREMLAALGVRSFTADDIEEMRATTYEEVIRKFPGLRIVNGNVRSATSRGAFNSMLAGSNVEFWVDGNRWTSMFSYNTGSLSMDHATDMDLIGNSLKPEHSYSSNMYNTLNEFAGMYPLQNMESIEYYKSSAALVISMSAAYNGGALVFTTKDGTNIKEWDADLFIREFKPLGYQDEPEAYRPHYIYDPTSDDTVFNAAWIPSATGLDEIPRQAGTTVVVEGIADGFIPVLVRESIPDTSFGE